MKINYLVLESTEELQKLVRNKIVSAVQCGAHDLVVARYGVNKASLIKISKQEMEGRK